jgi:histidinol-phosphate aminotransferase
VTQGRPRATPLRKAPSSDWPLRLDLTVNPYGPSIRVQEAIAAAVDLHLPTQSLESAIRRRLADMLSVSPDWIVLGAGVDDLLSAIYNWRRSSGPLIIFPPTDPMEIRQAKLQGIDVEPIARSHRFAVEIDPDDQWLIIKDATALVMSPNDPTGTLLSPQDAVRLSRRCDVVVVDERHGEYGGRSLVPLVREFDNMIILQTFETWAGLSGFPFAFAIGPAKMVGQIARHRVRSEIPASSLLAAEATLDDVAYVQATALRVREEKARLYRTLRKLNMLRPLPSWANFLLARVERGDPILFEQELADRGIAVYRPQHTELTNHLRISAVGPESTMELKRALIDIASTF